MCKQIIISSAKKRFCQARDYRVGWGAENGFPSTLVVLYWMLNLHLNDICFSVKLRKGLFWLSGNPANFQKYSSPYIKFNHLHLPAFVLREVMWRNQMRIACEFATTSPMQIAAMLHYGDSPVIIVVLLPNFLDYRGDWWNWRKSPKLYCISNGPEKTENTLVYIWTGMQMASLTFVGHKMNVNCWNWPLKLFILLTPKLPWPLRLIVPLIIHHWEKLRLFLNYHCRGKCVCSYNIQQKGASRDLQGCKGSFSEDRKLIINLILVQDHLIQTNDLERTSPPAAEPDRQSLQSTDSPNLIKKTHCDNSQPLLLNYFVEIKKVMGEK